MADRECNQCVHGSYHYCVDDQDRPIQRNWKSYEGDVSLLPTEPDTEKFLMYVQCKKNFGLPKSAFINANKCNLFKAKDKK